MNTRTLSSILQNARGILSTSTLATGAYAKDVNGDNRGMHCVKAVSRDLACCLWLAAEKHDPEQRDALFIQAWIHVKQQNGFTGTKDPEFCKYLDGKSMAWHDAMLEALINGKPVLAKATNTTKKKVEPSMEEYV